MFFLGHETLVLCVEIRYFGENLPKKKDHWFTLKKKPPMKLNNQPLVLWSSMALRPNPWNYDLIVI
jgi:hypothetical protein